MIDRIFMAVLAALCPLAAVTVAQEPPSTLWADPLRLEPFDTQPFRPIRVPEWVQDLTGCGYTLSVMDTAARERAARHGVRLSEMGFVDPFFTYYDSKLLKKRSPHVPLDRLEKDIAEYKRLGVRILGVYPPCLQGEVYELHPEWRRIATNTTEIPSVDMKVQPFGGMLCLLGPYGDFFIEVLAEILTKFPDVDAFSFDGLHYGGVCYCASCRDGFRQATGHEIPDANLDDPVFRRYQHWADRRMEALIRRMQTRLKAIKPTVALVTWTTNAGRFGHFLSIPRNMPSRMNLLLDAPDQEFWLDESNRGATIVPAFANAYIWATTNHRVAFSEPYLMSHGNPYGKDSFPAHEIERRMLLALTHGAGPSIAVAQPSRIQDDLYAAMDQVERRRPWITHKEPERWAALLMSDNTRNFYGRTAGAVEERYMAHVFGWFRAAMEEHLPVTVVNDWNLNPSDLAQYKLLILPNAACLSDAQVSAIRGFAEQGGGVIASLDTSLFNEYGDPRDNFALRDVLGVEFAGRLESAPVAAEIDVNFAKSITPDYWQKRRDVFDLKLSPGIFLESPKLAKLVGTDPVTFKGPAIRVRPIDETTRPLAQLATRTQPPSEGVAAVEHPFGKGRAIYLAAGLDAAYYSYAYPYQRLMLRSAVDRVASGPMPVVVEAPMCVQSTLMRQRRSSTDRLVLHLFNNVNTTAFHALPNDDVPLREETLPIHGIRVTFDRQYSIRRARLEPEGLDLSTESTPSGTAVVIPRLEVHSMVVVDLEPKPASAPE